MGLLELILVIVLLAALVLVVLGRITWRDFIVTAAILLVAALVLTYGVDVGD